MRDRDNICPCVWHQDEIKHDGHCKCHLFVGPNYDLATAYNPERGQKPLVEARSVRERIVTVYSNAWCPHSRRSRALLNQNQIAFEDVNFERDQAAARQVETWNNGYRSSPTIIIRLVLTEPVIAELERVLLNSDAGVLDLKAYTTSWCPDSRRTVAWFRQHRLPFTDIDIERDPAAAERVRTWNGGNLSSPTLEITLRVTEPSSDELLAALDLKEQPF